MSLKQLDKKGLREYFHSQGVKTGKIRELGGHDVEVELQSRAKNISSDLMHVAGWDLHLLRPVN